MDQRFKPKKERKKERAIEVLVGDMGEYFNVFGVEETFLFIGIKIRNLKVKDWHI